MTFKLIRYSNCKIDTANSPHLRFPYFPYKNTSWEKNGSTFHSNHKFLHEYLHIIILVNQRFSFMVNAKTCLNYAMFTKLYVPGEP